jgi:hypothetical protein
MCVYTLLLQTNIPRAMDIVYSGGHTYCIPYKHVGAAWPCGYVCMYAWMSAHGAPKVRFYATKEEQNKKQNFGCHLGHHNFATIGLL